MKKIKEFTIAYNESIKNIEFKKLEEKQELKEKIKCVKKHIHVLRIYLRNNDTLSESEEILFFKLIKPEVVGEMRFLKRKLTYLLEKPCTSIECQEEYIRSEIQKIKDFKQRNIVFYKYMKNNETLYDMQYFFRQKEQLEMFIIHDISDRNPEFTTTHDKKAAKIVAYDLLSEFYKNELIDLKNTDKNASGSSLMIKPPSSIIKWTASKTDLIELIYALKLSGAIDHGNGQLKLIVDSIASLFDVELGNYYKTFSEIKNRSKDKTRFLQQLSEVLNSYVEAEDEL